jgi:large subunit ribosomal protein L32e
MKKNNKELLELRNEMKSKKPNFLRQDAHKIKGLKKKWIKPKGVHSKMRLKLRSYRKQAGIGYSSPKEVKYLNREGFKEVLVNNLNDLTKIKDNEVILLSSKLGLKKKIEIIKKIQELKLKISNLKDADTFVKNIENLIKEKKKKREELKAKKEVKKEEEKKEEKKPIEGEEVKEKKEEEEKEAKRKVLEKRTSKEK